MQRHCITATPGVSVAYYSLAGAFGSTWPHRRHSNAGLTPGCVIGIMLIPHFGQIGRYEKWLVMLQCIYNRETP
jgi:hypothetical protein